MNFCIVNTNNLDQNTIYLLISPMFHLRWGWVILKRKVFNLNVESGFNLLKRNMINTNLCSQRNIVLIIPNVCLWHNFRLMKSLIVVGHKHTHIHTHTHTHTHTYTHPHTRSKSQTVLKMLLDKSLYY